jgi:hypothetical protein
MDKIQFVVNTLAENYGFDPKEALEYVINVQKEASPAYARAKKAIDTTEEKIAELQQKIDGRKVRNLDKANAKMDELKAKLEVQQERLDGSGKPKPRAKKAAPAPAQPVPLENAEDDIKAKRISKLSKSFADKLKSLFEETGTTMTDAHRKDFVKYINDLTRDDYIVKTMGEHMTDYIHMTTKPTTGPVDNGVVTLELKEILLLKHIVDGYGPGIFWDFANKRFITGPAETDEDAEDADFNEKTYAVGTITRRVYLPNDDGDVFVGFVGLGQFKAMTV